MRLVSVGVCALVCSVLPAQALRAEPRDSLRGEVRKAEGLGAKTGVCVLDARGRVVYEHRADTAVAPASNMKVLTAAAVLQGLGDRFQFVTRFELRDGALVVHASGDPNWITWSDQGRTAHPPAAKFGEVAARLQQLGVRAVRDIVLEPGVFTGPARPATWPQNQLHTYYAAPTGPFLLDQGIFVLRIDPRGRRRTAAVTLVAPPFGPVITGQIQLVGKRGVSSCGAIDRGDSLFVRGKLSQRSGAVHIKTAVGDAARWYERTLRAVLRRAGIRVTADAAAVPSGVVHEVRTDLAPAMLRILEDSSNVDAEQCLRVLGAKTRRDGSLAGGMTAMRAQLRRLVGALPDNCKLIDGSGLSAANRVTPALIAKTLHRAKSQPFFPTLFQALPIAARTGRLDDRFVGTPLAERVHAKTGWILGASSLSGYIEGKDGELLTFSILMDYPRNKGISNHSSLKPAQERIVAAIAREVGR